ncbi:MAG: hypothetical protein ACRD3S_03910, partial [Terracidiphilus sp.]
RDSGVRFLDVAGTDEVRLLDSGGVHRTPDAGDWRPEEASRPKHLLFRTRVARGWRQFAN